MNVRVSGFLCCDCNKLGFTTFYNIKKNKIDLTPLFCNNCKKYCEIKVSDPYKMYTMNDDSEDDSEVEDLAFMFDRMKIKN